MPLILASTSAIRRQLLDQAGIAYAAASPDCDEQAIKEKHRGSGGELALRLAEAKAGSLATVADAWVIGSDSVVEVDGRRFSKPRDRQEAAAHLAFFSGRTMTLWSAVALANDGATRWSIVDEARLHFRTLSPGFIDSYLDAEWPEVAYCVGVFRMEGRGITLFDRIDGSHFTILGLPLLPLLGALRQFDLIAS